MTNLVQFIFQLVVIYLVFWSMTNIKFTENDSRYPNQTALLKVFLSIAIGYVVSSFFVTSANLIWQF